MATPASLPQSALTRAMGMVGRAAAGAAAGVGRRQASRLAMKNLRLLLAVLVTGTAATAALLIVPILLVALTLGAGLSAALPVTGAGIGFVPGPALAPGMLACPVPGSVVSQPFGPSSLSGEPALFGYAHFHAGIDLAAPSGTVVLAAEGGTVSVATAQLNSLGLLTGYGNYVDIIAPGGVAAILSFHSLEDRLAKHAFQHRDLWTPLWKKPLTASEEERGLNPRSRSAKLRAARRMEDPEIPS